MVCAKSHLEDGGLCEITGGAGNEVTLEKGERGWPDCRKSHRKGRDAR